MKQMLLILAFLTIIAAPCAAQDTKGPFADLFLDVPANHWAYKDVDTLQKSGVEVLNPDKVFEWGHRPMSRYVFSFIIVRLLSQMSGPQTTFRTNIETRLLASPSALSALQDLVSHFNPELSLLDVDVDAVQMRLAKIAENSTRPLAAKPFPDVPSAHWAASAVETLRLNRIIAGYPQGTFTIPE